MMEHYFSKDPKSKFIIKKIKQNILGEEFEFLTASGIFSKEKADKGTVVLAESMVISNGCKVLDIGCGIGILGIVAAKVYGAKIVLTDINKRAVFLARKNLDLNKTEGRILHSDLYKKIQDKDFDVITSNPPQNAGKEICFQIIEQSKNHLKNGGNLQIVARPNKGGKTLAKKMEETFGNVDQIARKSGYAVYLSIKS